ncbi:hypothetical protein HIM_04560 [Hirsutella minnesotensis 3608]|uniref:Nitroreductase domain-containing protein n=1 Tax=Hirsutella minnesotensis 3608 TaxID=1043627 RepID=A0A0F8A5X8_9HYPO|nr:hypothetical protein HIM_04560 [Hirsutella minnesotensis 3608]
MLKRMLLGESIVRRHSSRGFLKESIPRSVLERALALAQHAPSNSNIQPWRVAIVSGSARDRLSAALLRAASQGEPHIPPLPEAFRHHRSELGRALYGGVMGIPREDVEARRAAQLRNFDFFGAPTVAIIAMDRRLGPPDSLSVGMWLQIFLLALADEDVGSCVQVSVAGYPDILKAELGMSNDLDIICGVALGYPDPDYKGNSFRAIKEPFETVTKFIDT